MKNLVFIDALVSFLFFCFTLSSFTASPACSRLIVRSILLVPSYRQHTMGKLGKRKKASASRSSSPAAGTKSGKSKTRKEARSRSPSPASNASASESESDSEKKEKELKKKEKRKKKDEKKSKKEQETAEPAKQKDGQESESRKPESQKDGRKPLEEDKTQTDIKEVPKEKPEKSREEIEARLAQLKAEREATLSKLAASASRATMEAAPSPPATGGETESCLVVGHILDDEPLPADPKDKEKRAKDQDKTKDKEKDKDREQEKEKSKHKAKSDGDLKIDKGDKADKSDAKKNAVDKNVDEKNVGTKDKDKNVKTDDDAMVIVRPDGRPGAKLNSSAMASAGTSAPLKAESEKAKAPTSRYGFIMHPRPRDIDIVCDLDLIDH